LFTKQVVGAIYYGGLDGVRTNGCWSVTRVDVRNPTLGPRCRVERVSPPRLFAYDDTSFSTSNNNDPTALARCASSGLVGYEYMAFSPTRGFKMVPHPSVRLYFAELYKDDTAYASAPARNAFNALARGRTNVAPMINIGARYGLPAKSVYAETYAAVHNYCTNFNLFGVYAGVEPPYRQIVSTKIQAFADAMNNCTLKR
jgi:hypothetical protein